MLKLRSQSTSFLLLLKTLFFIGLMTVSYATYAEQWYHVELIVFEQLDSVSDELAPVARVPNATYTPNSTSDMIQPAANSTLNDSAARLKNSRRYQVHYHQSWKQPIKTKANAKSVAINSNLIDGRVRLHKGTYLYATVDLQLDRASRQDDWSETGGTRKPYLKEARRVRSGKLQFFDHPNIGALLKLTPL
jgi:hypothetical protein